ncbi:MAG TPA: bifunctional NAD(P)/FAD-dependent oxidoreductase/class I SAM-dependent methyltransferase [Blastococcus sp.]
MSGSVVEERYDVVVVGGGAAGLSGALALVRSRRRVLVIDAGSPRNAPAGHVHNFLTRDGTPPGDLLALGRAEVAGYGGEFVDGAVAAASRDDDGFVVTLADGREVRARRLLVTSGLVDELPDVPGLDERWGRDVLHCPYCHGWEVRDQPIGVLATGALAVHQALMFRQLSADVTLLLHTEAPLGPDEAEQLAARGVSVVEGEVAAVEVSEDRLSGVRLRSGDVVPLEALVVSPRFSARADVLLSLGLRTVELEMGGHVLGAYVAADAMGATEAPGVWVAGNVTDLRAQVISSAAAGLNAGAAINADLIAEDVRLAVADARQERLTMFEEPAWEERYRSAPAVWSRDPNAQLVAEASDLAPGRALDVGCGEGADAIWLAARGWRVTAVDFSTTALERGAASAEALGADVAARIEWCRADVRSWTPPAGSFDLVSAQFMHLPTDERRPLFQRLADAVAPGGTLLLVGHDVSDLVTGAHRVHAPDMFFTAEEVATSLDPGTWEVLVADARPRPAKSHEGEGITVRDAVVRARRTSSGAGHAQVG